MIDQFLKIEQEQCWLEDRINGFHLWQYIRVVVFNEIRKEQGEILPHQTAHQRPSMVYIAKLAWKHSLLLHAKPADLFLRDHYRHTKNERGNYESIYTADFLKTVPYSSIIAETYTLNELDSPLEQQTIYNTADLRLLSQITERFFKSKQVEQQICEQVQRYIDLLDQQFGVTLNRKQLQKKSVKLYTNWRFYCWYYKKVLKKMKPKLIMEVVSYEFNNMVINDVAKQMDIPTVELQHGLMGAEHVAYNFKQKGRYATFTDHVFTYSDFWKQCTRFPLEDDHVVPIGFSYLEKVVDKYKTTAQNDVKNILFISQWSIGKQLSEFAVALTLYLDEQYPGQFQITYKMHPEESLADNDNYQLLRQHQERIDIIQKDGPSLYECFGKADVQVGVYSTGLYEGIAFDLQTLIFQTSGSSQMKPLVDLGYASYVSQPNEVVQALSSAQSVAQTHQFWQNNAAQKLLDEVDRLISI